MFDSTIHISVDNLNENFLETLREQYPHASLEIKVQKKENGEALTEEQFWSLINLIDWSRGDENNSIIIRTAVKALAARPLRQIYEFQDILSKKLFDLDTKAHAKNVGENAWQREYEFFSVDEFLYARCCVVANGKELYQQVLNNPAEMPKDLTFEALLRIARQAYLIKTGKEFRYVPAFNIETFANRKGWKS